MKFLLKRIKKNLVIGFSRCAGKNFLGRKTIFTQSGGLKFKLRKIDYNRLNSYNGFVLNVEKNISHSSFIGFIAYENGIFNYILLSNLNQYLDKIIYGFKNCFIKEGVSFIGNFSNGMFAYNIEIKPGKGAALCRAAGLYATIVSKNLDFTFLKLNSGWMVKVSNFCVAINGMVSNELHKLERVKNAGKNRKLGFRPTVRGIAKNPCDHPHGGGEGRGSPPKAQKTPWGKLTKAPTKVTLLSYKKKNNFKIYKKK